MERTRQAGDALVELVGIEQVNIPPLLAPGRHLNIELTWDSDQMHLAVREQHARRGPLLEGHWPRPE